MRTSVAFASLVLLLLATTAHGIRPDRQLQEAINKKKVMGDPKTGQAPVIDHSANKHCDLGGHCSSGTAKTPPTHSGSGAVKQTTKRSAGNGHKTTTVFETDATTTAHGRHEAAAAEATNHGPGQEEVAAATPRVPWQGQTYPDIMDIAGMDYSPAQRRSPIHN